MSTRNTMILTIVGLFVVAAVSLWAAPHMPDIVPTHWNIHGKPDHYGSKWFNLLLTPGIMVVMIALLFGLPSISPENFKIDSFRETYNVILVIVVGLFAYIHIVLVMNSLNPIMDMGKAIFGGMMLFFALMGNFMGKVRRNFFMGLRTPWTLANDTVWVATHRLAAKTMVGGGIASAVMCFAGVNLVIPIVVITAAMLWPAIYSLILCKKLEREKV